MPVDFGEYLQVVEVSAGERPLLHHASSLKHSVFVGNRSCCWSPTLPRTARQHPAADTSHKPHLSHPTLHRTCPSIALSSAAKSTDKCAKHVTNFELRQKVNVHGQPRSPSCLRKGPGERFVERSSSIQNHWTAASGASANLTVYLGRALTLHSSPRIKRKSKKKHVKFADDYGETLVTFYIVPKLQESRETGYWPFLDQLQYDREHYEEDMACEEEEEEEEEDSSDVGSPEDTVFPWQHSRFEFPQSAPQAAPLPTSPSTPSPPTASCTLHFEQPAADFSVFQNKLLENCVGLENVKVDTGANVVTCSIKVRNLHHTKKVFARCTSDGWKTFADLPAIYSDPGYESSVYDNFSFAITRPLVSSNNARMEFAVCYQVNGETYWDNNTDENYVIEWTASE